MQMNGSSKEIAIEVVPIKSNGSFYLIVFNEQDIPGPSPAITKALSGKKQNGVERKVTKNLEAQLMEARDSIRIISEDFEATREELQSQMKKYYPLTKSCRASMKNLKHRRKSCNQPTKS